MFVNKSARISYNTSWLTLAVRLLCDGLTDGEKQTHIHTHEVFHLDLHTTQHTTQTQPFIDVEIVVEWRILLRRRHSLQPSDFVPLLVVTICAYATPRDSHNVLFFSSSLFRSFRSIHPSDKGMLAATVKGKRKFHGAPRQRLFKQNLKLNTFATNTRIKRWHTRQSRSHNVCAFDFLPFTYVVEKH